MVYENIITGVEEDKLLPYEKCLEYGATALDNAELLAAIIRTGTNGLSSIELAEKYWRVPVILTDYIICLFRNLCRSKA